MCQAPDTGVSAIAFDKLAKIIVETNDTGPWGMDVWWHLLDDDNVCWLSFPQGASGEAAVLDRFFELPGFKIDGMHSTSNASFLCWQRPA